MISYLFILGCRNEKEAHLGTWESSSRSSNDTDEYYTITLNNLNQFILGGKTESFESEIVISYEIDYAKKPIWFDIIYSNKNTSEELSRTLYIVRFPSKNEMELRGSKNVRFDEFNSDDKKTTLFFKRITSISENKEKTIASEDSTKIKKFPFYKTDLEIMNLRGRVKYFREYSYKAIDSFGKISKGERQFKDGFKSIPYGGYFTFNKDGNFYEVIEYDKNGLIKGKDVYTYNKNGYKIERNTYASERKLQYKIIYKYDEKGYLIDESLYNELGKLENKVVVNNNEENQEIIKKSYDSKGDPNGFDELKYDEKGNLIDSRHNSFGIKSSRIIYMKYDKKGNLIEENSHYTIKEGSVDILTNFKYNKHDDIIEYWFDSSDESKTKYEYVYDSNLNWIKRIEFDNGFPQYIIERKIEYY